MPGQNPSAASDLRGVPAPAAERVRIGFFEVCAVVAATATTADHTGGRFMIKQARRAQDYQRM